MRSHSNNNVKIEENEWETGENIHKKEKFFRKIVAIQGTLSREIFPKTSCLCSTPFA